MRKRNRVKEPEEVKPEFHREEVLIIRKSTCPEKVLDALHEAGVHRGHHCDWFRYGSEMEPFGNNDWSDLSMERIENYWKDQCNRLGEYAFKGDLNQFIEDYHLVVDKWLIDSKIDLTGVKNIFFVY